MKNSESLKMASAIAAAYVSKNRVYVPELPDRIGRIYASLNALAARGKRGHARFRFGEAQVAASVKRSRIISFIDGKPYKSPRWQLEVHGLTPDQYRARFGLPDDYPIVAPVYDKSLRRGDASPVFRKR